MSRPTDTREQLLELAMQQLEERGEQGLRVNELCAEVGVPVTSLYHFFGSREGLVEAAYAEMFVLQLHRDLELLKARAMESEDAAAFRTLFEEALGWFLRPEREALRLRRMQILGAAYRRPGLRAAVGKAQGRFLAEFAAAMDLAKSRGWVRADLDTQGYAAWFEGQLLGQVLVLMEGGDVTREQWAKVSLEAVLAVVFGEAPGAKAAG